MAFAGLHAVAGYRGAPGFRGNPSGDVFQITGSQSVATGTLSTLTAPAISEEKGQPVFRVYAAADSWVSVGAAPNEAADPRILVKGLVITDILAKPGDKLKWVAA
jgi:hypothetical protein